MKFDENFYNAIVSTTCLRQTPKEIENMDVNEKELLCNNLEMIDNLLDMLSDSIAPTKKIEPSSPRESNTRKFMTLDMRSYSYSTEDYLPHFKLVKRYLRLLIRKIKNNDVSNSELYDIYERLKKYFSE